MIGSLASPLDGARLPFTVTAGASWTEKGHLIYCAMPLRTPLRTAKSSYYPRWRRSGFFGALGGLGGRLGAQARDRAFGRPRDTTRQHLSASGAG